jgi:hypothetical protein
MGGNPAGLSGRVRAPTAQPTARRRSTCNIQGGEHLLTRKIGPEGGARTLILATALLPPPSTPRHQNSKTDEKMDKSDTGSVLSTSRLVGGALTRGTHQGRFAFQGPGGGTPSGRRGGSLSDPSGLVKVTPPEIRIPLFSPLSSLRNSEDTTVQIWNTAPRSSVPCDQKWTQFVESHKKDFV